MKKFIFFILFIALTMIITSILITLQYGKDELKKVNLSTLLSYDKYLGELFISGFFSSWVVLTLYYH